VGLLHGLSAKAGLAQSMARSFGPRESTSRHVPIDAAIGWTRADGTRAHRLAGTAVEDNMADPDAIAETYCRSTASIARLGRSKWCCGLGREVVTPSSSSISTSARRTHISPIS